MDKVKNSRLKKVIKELPPEKKLFAEQLAVEIEFMANSLSEMRHIVEAEGAIVSRKNGNGFLIQSEHPAQKSYNTTLKGYTSAIKQLTGLLETEQQKEELDDFQAMTGLK